MAAPAAAPAPAPITVPFCVRFQFLHELNVNARTMIIDVIFFMFNNYNFYDYKKHADVRSPQTYIIAEEKLHLKKATFFYLNRGVTISLKVLPFSPVKI